MEEDPQVVDGYQGGRMVVPELRAALVEELLGELFGFGGRRFFLAPATATPTAAAPRAEGTGHCVREDRVGFVGHQQLQGFHVSGLGRPPEGGGAGFVFPGLVEVVAGVPDLVGEPGVWIGAGLEQGFHQLQVRGLFLLRARLGIERRGRPVDIDAAVQRACSHVVGEVGIRTALEQHHGQVEVAVDGGDHQGAALVTAVHPVDVGSRVQEQVHRCLVPLPGRVEQGGVAAATTHG